VGYVLLVGVGGLAITYSLEFQCQIWHDTAQTGRHVGISVIGDRYMGTTHQYRYFKNLLIYQYTDPYINAALQFRAWESS